MIKLILEAVGIPLAVAALLMPFIARLAHRLRIVDTPSARKIHLKPTPLLGGLAVYVAVIVFEAGRGAIAGKVLALVLACGVSVALGAADDRYDMPSRFRLGVHLALGLLLGVAGFRTQLLPYGLDLALSTIWITGMINAVNCFDCADGIVGGLSGVALIFYGMVLVIAGHLELALIAFAFAGAAFGFLLYNFPPARIFMGDCGSTTFGLLLGAISLRVAADSAAPFAWCAALPVALPVGDILLVHVRRYLGGMHSIRDLLASTGKDHLPHRLLRIGFTHRQTALFIYVMTAVMGSAMVLARRSLAEAVILIAIASVPVLFAEHAYLGRRRAAASEDVEKSVRRPVAAER